MFLGNLNDGTLWNLNMALLWKRENIWLQKDDATYYTRNIRYFKETVWEQMFMVPQFHGHPKPVYNRFLADY